MPSHSTWIWLAACALAVVAIIWFAVAASPAASPTPTTVADPSALPGISRATAPWPVEVAHLAERLAADNLVQQTMEGQVMHIHQHLDLFVHGASVTVPADIGINEPEGWLSALHSHDTRGIIHVESPFKAVFTLGQFFDVWGVLFTSDCIGGYCTDETNSLKVYVNGELYSGDPRTLALDEHQEIAIVYGTESEAPRWQGTGG